MKINQIYECVVYTIKNIVTDKLYVGSSIHGLIKSKKFNIIYK